MTFDDIPGWFPIESSYILGGLIDKHKVRTVIEIGSYLGRSTAFFASKVEHVTAIDPFVMWEEGRNDGTPIREAGEDFYDKFLANTSTFPNITTFRAASEDAWKTQKYRFVADMIYIDALHDYESVKADILMWQDRTMKVICGDDYDDNWPDVQQAVDELLPNRVVEGRIWYAIM